MLLQLPFSLVVCLPNSNIWICASKEKKKKKTQKDCKWTGLSQMAGNVI